MGNRSVGLSHNARAEKKGDRNSCRACVTWREESGAIGVPTDEHIPIRGG